MKQCIDRRQFNLGGIAAGALLAAPRIARAAPVKIRCGWVVIPASLAPLVLEKKDILKHFGQSYVAEATRFEGTPPVITALASGDLDIGPLAFSSFGLAIQNAHMDDLRVISDEIEDGVAGHGTNQFMVLKDGPVKTVADLKGKVLATNVIGSAVDIAMRAVLPAQRVGGQPRLHHRRGPLPGHACDARREKGRPDQRGAAILARSRPQRHGA